MKENIAHNAKIETINKMIVMMEEQVELARDIYDTYFYVVKNDEEFSKKLWNLLTDKNKYEIHINSYFSWEIGYGGYVMLSRYGVCIYNQAVKKTLIKDFNVDEKDLYRGKIMLKNYLEKYYVSDEILDKMIEDLQVFLSNFRQYAEKFFNSVSSYSIVE
jgi:maltose-binding protein MalE